MNYHLEILEDVKSDLEEAVTWYEGKKAGLGIDLLNEWEQKINHICVSPEHYQIQFKHTRHAYLKKFPYLIVYEISNTTIVIYAFLHAKQSPARRTKRLKK
jgi:hypothetical protein